MTKDSSFSAFIHTLEILYKASQQCQPSFTEGSQDSTRTQRICPILSSRVVRQKQIPGLIQAWLYWIKCFLFSRYYTKGKAIHALAGNTWGSRRKPLSWQGAGGVESVTFSEKCFMIHWKTHQVKTKIWIVRKGLHNSHALYAYKNYCRRSTFCFSQKR